MASYATHAPPSVMLGTTALFATGALVMRGAGCTINDMWDKNLDSQVGTLPVMHINHWSQFYSAKHKTGRKTGRWRVGI